MNLTPTPGPNVWRRLGDLATDAYALAIHRESSHAEKIPFFLSESRRRTFASVYQVDKVICTFLDRPPRILRRFSDCKMPLDLSDKELLAEPNEANQFSQSLGPDGWNPTPRYLSSTWARLRYILGVFREEVMEFPFRPLTPENKAKLLYGIQTHFMISWTCMLIQFAGHYRIDVNTLGRFCQNISNTLIIAGPQTSNPRCA